MRSPLGLSKPEPDPAHVVARRITRWVISVVEAYVNVLGGSWGGDPRAVTANFVQETA